MSKIVGVVEDVKIYEGPAEKWVKTSIAVQGNWYGGFQSKESDDPLKQVKPGDTVELEYEQNGKYFNIKTLAIKAIAPPPALVAPTGQPTTGNAYIDNRSFEMTKGNAAKLATGFVLEAVKLDALTTPATKNKKAAAMMALIEHFTKEFTKMIISITPESLVEETATEVEGEAGNE